MGVFFVPAVKTFARQQENIWLFWVAFFLSIGLLIGLVCCGEIRRKAPHNMILLGAFTVTEGVLLGLATSTYDADAVLMGKRAWGHFLDKRSEKK